jgi:beta-glucosidase/6-phospho-beta-glucosidase/beta-galactosidase
LKGTAAGSTPTDVHLLIPKRLTELNLLQGTHALLCVTLRLQWFEERGGWLNPDNVPAFVSYCSLIFREFAPRIPFWATFNEPSCFALCGYIMGLWAPGKRGRLIQAGKVLGNMLKAHVAAYRKLKAMPHGDTAQVNVIVVRLLHKRSSAGIESGSI